MRVLARAERPMDRAEVARRAELDPSGVRRALEGLMLTGAVEAVGSGNRQQVAIRKEYPLAPALRQLFAAEFRRAEDVYGAVRSAADRVAPRLEAVWLAVPEHATRAGVLELIQVWIYGRSRDVDAAAEQVRERLVDAAGRYSVQFDVRPLTRADLAVLPEESRDALLGTEVVFGPDAEVLLDPAAAEQTTARRHVDLDRRSRRVHRVLAEWISKNPSIVDRAKACLRRQIEQATPSTRRELQEWLDLLETMPLTRLLHFISDPGERATRLRQSSPFVPVLSDSERREVQEKAR